MDSIVFKNEFVALADASLGEKSWTDFLSQFPDIANIFKSGVAKPVFIDLMMADKEFKPFHADKSKDGTAYKVTRDAIEQAVETGAFTGRPLYLYDLDKADHGFGKAERRVVGTIHGAVMRESDKGAFPQLLTSVWPAEIPDGFEAIQNRAETIGASIEMDIERTKDCGDHREITKFMPHGALILNKDLASFKDSAIYCSDSDAGGEPVEEQPEIEKTDCDAPIPKKRGTNLKICKDCTPLVEEHTTRAVDKATKKLTVELKTYGDISSEMENLRIAAADATKEAENSKKRMDDTQTFLNAENEKNNENLKNIVAAGDVNKMFDEKLKGEYPEDKHQEVKRILLKSKLGKPVSPEEVLNLANWKNASPDKGGSQLGVAGTDNDGGQGLNDKQLDDLLGLNGLAGIAVPEGGSG